MSAQRLPPVRIALDSEYEAIGALTVESYRALAGRPSLPAYDAELADVAGRPSVGTVFVATGDDGAPIGSVTLSFASPMVGLAQIRYLAVAPDHQASGAGRALLEAVSGAAVSAGCRGLVLWTAGYMERAITLYERFGFVRRSDLDEVQADGPVLRCYVLTFASSSTSNCTS